MEELTNIFAFISLPFVVTVILAVYVIIKGIESATNTDLKTWIKKLISGIVGVLAAVVYAEYKLAEVQSLIPSYFVSLIAYDYAIKKILDKLITPSEKAITVTLIPTNPTEVKSE